MISDIINCINKYDSFLIAIHESPDGDSVGSMFSLFSFLKSLNKDVVMYSMDTIPERFNFLENTTPVIKDLSGIDRKFDVLFLLDCAGKDRAGKAIDSFTSYKKLINIDHHVSNPLFGDINFVNPSASCTGELIYKVIENIDINLITKSIANSLLTAIYDDTGSLRYSSAGAETFKIASKLVDFGANPFFISNNLYFSVSKNKMDLYVRVLESLKFDFNDKAAYIVMKKEDMEKTNTSYDDSEGFIDIPRSVKGVSVAFFIKEVKEEFFKISFRSDGSVNVNDFCNIFGGGGHKAAAACSIKGSLEEVLNKIKYELKKFL